MAKFKTDGFKIAKDFMSKNLFTDARVFKSRGEIEVWLVKDGMLFNGMFGDGKAYNNFKSQEEVNQEIDDFIKVVVKGEEEA